MADFREFIIAPQDLSGIEKISEGLGAKQAAKAKAAQEAKAQKTANLASLDYLDDKNFLTGTVEDPVVTRELYKIRDKAYQLASVPGMDSSMIKMAISPEVSKLTQSVQTIKTIDAQRKQGLEFAKSQKGIIPQNYDTEFLRNTFLIPDEKGNYKVREDIYNIDPTLNYDAATRKSGSIYNVDEAVGEDIKNMAKASNKYTVKERGADGKLHSVTKNIETTTGFDALLDNQGVFQGVVPQHTIAPQTDETKSINQYLTGTQNPTEPLRLASDDLYSRVQNNPSIMGAVNADTVEYAKSLGRTPKTEEIIAFQKAKLYDIYSRSGRSGFKREDVKVDLAPIVKSTTNVNVGGAGDAVRDLYTPAKNIYDNMQSLKTKAVQLFKNGKSVEDVAKELNLDPTKSKPFLQTAQQGKGTYTMPLNTENLDAEFTTSIVKKLEDIGAKYIENESGDKKSYDAGNLAIRLNKQGNWEIFPYLNNKLGERITTMDAATLGYKVQPSKYGKSQLATEEKANTKKTKKSDKDPLGINQ
jgi:hypothetical protein